ncbi:hypothetical protein [Streptomyces sp. TR02-1]|uniref:hypothetical protein n=1 Tax=Streptomyces sp. TR02-1 TaxID=3385977 RepID=UPI0039A3D648
MGPPPPGGGNRGTRVAAIVVGSVLVAALAVGGVVLWAGGGGGERDTEAVPGGSAGTSPSPDAGDGSAEPSGAPGSEEAVPEGSPDPGEVSPAPSSGRRVPYVVLEPGECFDHPGLSSDVTVVETRSCEVPHNGEVIANETLTGSFADASELRTKVLALCRDDAKDRLRSMPRDGRTYYYYAIFPSLTTYRTRGDDTISCALTLSNTMDGTKLTAPLRD